MGAFSRYEIFCKVIELGSFTKVANEIGYSQSAISQIIKGMEQEMGSCLIVRGKDGVHLTEDGREIYPYIQSISMAERDLERKQREMQGLTSSEIRVLTFTSVSRTILPGLMQSFKQKYPDVKFHLKQGDYETVLSEIREGTVDFGFISQESAASSELQTRALYKDGMVVVLPKDHPLSEKDVVSLQDLIEEPFILLDEGRSYNTVLDAFRKIGKQPNIQYDLYDDYSILEMIRQGFGISILFKNVVRGFEEGLEIREIRENLSRTVALAWKDWDTMPLAARKFAEHVIKRQKELTR